MDARSVSPPERTIGAREFKDSCLQILREVEETGEAVVVTRHQAPIVRISPAHPKGPASLFGRCKGELEIVGDIMAPAFGRDEFDMNARPERVLDPEGYDRRGVP